MVSPASSRYAGLPTRMRAVVPFGLNAHGRGAVEVVRFRDREPLFLPGRQDGAAQRMFGVLLRDAGQMENVIRRSPVEADDLHHLRPAEGERSRLVDQQVVDLVRQVPGTSPP